MVVARPVAPAAVAQKDAAKAQRSGQRMAAHMCRAGPALCSSVAAEGEAPEEMQLLLREEAAGLGSRTSLLLTSLGPGVAASKPGAPSSNAVSWRASSI